MERRTFISFRTEESGRERKTDKVRCLRKWMRTEYRVQMKELPPKKG